MDLSNRNIGYGITGSFCTFAKTRKEIQRLTEMGAHVIPIFSYQTQNCDTRFGTAKEFMEEVCDITGNPGIRTLQEAEPNRTEGISGCDGMQLRGLQEILRQSWRSNHRYCRF